MRWHGGTVVAVFALVATWVACSDYDAAEAPQGALDQPCFQNGTCLADLACIAGRCRPAGGDAGASSSSGSSSSSGASPSFAALDSARCEHILKCTVGVYKDKAACLAAMSDHAPKMPGVAVPTQAQLDACTARFVASKTCDGFTTYEECVFPGTLPRDTRCFSDTQCADGACKRLSADDDCGKCGDALAVGAVCDFLTPCKGGFLCSGGVCAKPIGPGGDCSGGRLCGEDTLCIGNTCSPGRAEGQVCTSTDCAYPLFCDAKHKCARQNLVSIGDACGAEADVCVDSWCDFDTTSKCEARRPKDAACTGSECAPPLVCRNEKCAEPTASATCL